MISKTFLLKALERDIVEFEVSMNTDNFLTLSLANMFDREEFDDVYTIYEKNGFTSDIETFVFRVIKVTATTDADFNLSRILDILADLVRNADETLSVFDPAKSDAYLVTMIANLMRELSNYATPFKDCIYETLLNAIDRSEVAGLRYLVEGVRLVTTGEAYIRE